LPLYLQEVEGLHRDRFVINTNSILRPWEWNEIKNKLALNVEVPISFENYSEGKREQTEIIDEIIKKYSEEKTIFSTTKNLGTQKTFPYSYFFTTGDATNLSLPSLPFDLKPSKVFGSGSYLFNAFIVYGVGAYKRGDLESAKNYFIDATIVRPENLAAWNNLAIVHYESGDVLNAIEAWEAALKIENDSQIRANVENLKKQHFT
jgi:tetratricopeptide (TPR) repeat protein